VHTGRQGAADAFDERPDVALAGYQLGLCWLVLLCLSVLAILAVDAAAGVAVELVPVVIFGVVTGVAALLALLALMPGGRPDVSRSHASGPFAS
jgi:hypothetical protein